MDALSVLATLEEEERREAGKDFVFRHGSWANRFALAGYQELTWLIWAEVGEMWGKNAC